MHGPIVYMGTGRLDLTALMAGSSSSSMVRSRRHLTFLSMDIICKTLLILDLQSGEKPSGKSAMLMEEIPGMFSKR